MTPEQIIERLHHPIWLERVCAIHDKNATSEILFQGLNDEHPWVRLWVLKNKNVTTEHINIALNDSDPDVREFAKHHPLNNGFNRLFNRIPKI